MAIADHTPVTSAAEPSQAFSAVSNAEDDMCAVYDYALILFEGLTEGSVCAEKSEALARIAGQLMTTGKRLKLHNAAIYRAVSTH